jgi:hypothetical protein
LTAGRHGPEYCTANPVFEAIPVSFISGKDCVFLMINNKPGKIMKKFFRFDRFFI